MASLMDAIVSSGIKGVGEGLGALLKDVRTAITGETAVDPTAAAEIQFKILALKAEQEKSVAELEKIMLQGQIDLMKADALSTDKFQSRPRPTVMWICAGGLAYEFILRPLLPWLVNVGGIIVCSIFTSLKPSPVPLLPPLDVATLMMLLIPLLGLGAMRSWEKGQGVAK